MPPKGPSVRTVAKQLFQVGLKAKGSEQKLLVEEMQAWCASADPQLLKQLLLITKNNWIQFITAE
eukprot:9905130-Lingulodinium_polyedra.AAC.1